MIVPHILEEGVEFGVKNDALQNFSIGFLSY
jgi:hypothetical protein